MNEDKKLISAIVVVAIAILLVSGGTLAYWQWSTSELQSTLVNGSPAGDLDQTRMYIDFPENELTNLYPTSDCDPNGTSSWVTEITIDNKTGVLVAPNFKLKVKIEDKNGNVITNVTNPGNTNPNRYYIKYAVTGENESCQNALATGRFDQNTQTFSGQTTWYDSELITEQGTNGFPVVSGKIGSGVSFHGLANRETTQRFRVYAWLDKEYTSLNVGTEVTDTMQDAKVTVSWSENSNLEQVKKTKTGEAYAVYSEDDNSLRFYRSETPITQGSTYNGRTVTNVYTGFETTIYKVEDEVPWGFWNENVPSTVKIKNVVFEDYIYPIGTAYWFHTRDEIEKIDATKLDTSNVTDMYGMFYDVGSNTLSSSANIIGLENWDTSNVTNMSSMFGETRLNFNLRNWNVCKVIDYDFFNIYWQDEGEIYDENLDEWIYISEGEYENNIIKPYFGNLAKCNGGKPEPGTDPFAGEAIAIYSEDDNSLRFYRDSIEHINNINVGEMYRGRTVTSKYTGFEDNSFGPWGNNEEERWETEIIVFEDYIKPSTTSSWFYEYESVTYIDVSKLEVSEVTSMRSMFNIFGISSVDIVGLDTWDTSNVKYMDDMFSETNFTSDGIKAIEKWDTSNVIDMYAMFMGYRGIDLNLSKWNVCKVTRYEYFGGGISEYFGDPTKCNGGNPA